MSCLHLCVGLEKDPHLYVGKVYMFMGMEDLLYLFKHFIIKPCTCTAGYNDIMQDVSFYSAET